MAIQNQQILEIVNLLRNKFSNFSLVNIIEDLEKAIEDFGVKVFYSNMEGFDDPMSISGYSQVNKKGHPEIIVNGNESFERRRFTIAHELGHIILHWGWLNEVGQTLDRNLTEIQFRKTKFSYGNGQETKEQQANHFAAELLLPLETLKNFINDESLDTELKRIMLITNISKVFKVSESFARIQLSKLEKQTT